MSEIMAFENLSERERAVLANLISHYVSTADPVGSRIIATKYKMGLSSATIRNTMQDLEDMGLISQPHTSAGRVPTDIGYRLYVDSLLQREELSGPERDAILASIAGDGDSIEAILGQSTRALADIAHQMGVTVAPKFESGKLSRLQLVRLSSEKILVVLVVKSGLARTVVLEVEASLPEEHLAFLEAALNEKLAGLSLGEIRKSISSRLASIEGNPRLLKLFVDPDSSIWQSSRGAQMHIMGAENLLRQPEFADRSQLVEFISALQDESKLIGELSSDDNTDAPGVMVKIGTENTLSEMQKCSVVSANYKVGHIEGKIAVIGPTRMRYGKLLSIVEYAAKSISENLASLEDD